MAFDFTSIMERRGHDAWAVDGVGSTAWPGIPAAPKPGFDFIPLWVADMNFPTCPSVTRAIAKRLENKAFGYYQPSDAYYDAICTWRRPGHPDVQREHIGYENGVHGFITSAVQVLTQPGDAILVHTPMYLGFHADIDQLGRKPVFSPLVQDEQGIWRMDFANMDAMLEESGAHVAIFCSPHNPTGRVWERWELERALAVFAAHDVTVISDEIWSDIIFASHEHIPTQMVNDWARDNVVAAYAPSKTFNLAGLVGSYHIIYNDRLHKQIASYGAKTHYNEMNVLSMHALVGAYSDEGRAWLAELNQVLEGNARLACSRINAMPGVSVTMPQGTYMLFLDVAEHLLRTGTSLDDVLKAGWDVGLGWQDGRQFHGPTHVRVNLASPQSRIVEALDRMERYVFSSCG